MTGGAVAAPQTSVWAMYRALVGVGLGCGLLIVSVYELTGPIIRQNKLEARERAILDVLPAAATSRAFVATADGGFEPTSPDREDGELVFAGYDAGGGLVGLAIEASGMGYQDVIRVLYGYSFERQAIIGIRVLESRETPGLGDRVETDPAFLRNFERLDVSLDDAGTAVRHPIQPVKPGEKTEPWQIDTISGATITSKAIADLLRASSERWVPRLVANRENFLREG